MAQKDVCDFNFFSEDVGPKSKIRLVEIVGTICGYPCAKLDPRPQKPGTQLSVPASIVEFRFFPTFFNAWGWIPIFGPWWRTAYISTLTYKIRSKSVELSHHRANFSISKFGVPPPPTSQFIISAHRSKFQNPEGGSYTTHKLFGWNWSSPLF